MTARTVLAEVVRAVSVVLERVAVILRAFGIPATTEAVVVFYSIYFAALALVWFALVA